MTDPYFLSKKAFFPRFQPGHVWLAGAGPGDPGLLTLHTLHALRQADIVLYDALVDSACLNYAKEDCVLEFAGKRGGFVSPKQDEISARLIALANSKRKVLRLKGGDPFIFGRGGDEAMALALAKIPFRIIPGVTAGIAGPAYAGIPVTSRLLNQSVTFVTGYDSHGTLPTNLNWHALVRGANVLVFYMATKHIEEIASALLKAGCNGDKPIAFISHATTKKQRVVTMELQNILKSFKTEFVPAPAIIVVGEVVHMRKMLNWLPVSGGVEQS